MRNRTIIVGGCAVVWLALAGCQSSTFEVSRIRELTIYGVAARGVPAFETTELARYPAYRVDPEILRDLMPEAQFVPDSPVWKGSRLAVAETADGQQRRLALSYYGGFFQVLESRGYYVFTGPERSRWERVLSRALAATRGPKAEAD